MTSGAGFFSSSIGKKYIMGITGLGLSLFVLTHMIGNVLLFVSGEAYNTYSHKLISNPFIYVAEAGLVALFLSHIFLAIRLTLANRAARGDRYSLTTRGEKGVSYASKTMIHQGMVLFIFTVHHLITFKYGPYYEVTYNGVVMRDLMKLVGEVFQSPIYVGWYTLAMIALTLHLSHGVQSTFQSFGINHPNYTPIIKRVGLVYALVVGLGFLSQPLYVFFFLNQ